MRKTNAQMAESVDALVSNTSGATHPGSIPGLGTEAERVEKPLRFFVFLRNKGGSKNSEFRFYLFSTHENRTKINPT